MGTAERATLFRRRNRRSIIGGFWLDAFELGQDLVRALLRDQRPEVADLSSETLMEAGITSSGASGMS